MPAQCECPSKHGSQSTRSPDPAPAHSIAPSTPGDEGDHRSDGPPSCNGREASGEWESAPAAESVDWLWPGRVALGHLTILVGGTMSGKSFLSADLAARVTNGTAWPDALGDQADGGDGEIPPRPQPARVLIVPGNPSRARRLPSRLAAAGADMDRIIVLPAGQAALPVDQILASIEQSLTLAGDCKLLIFEPPSVGFTSRGQELDEASMTLFQSLADLAARRGVAVLAVVGLRHDFSGPVSKRQLGALASCGAAMSVWALLRDEASPELRYVVAARSPEADDRTAMAFRIRRAAGIAPGAAARVEWRAEGLATADGASRALGGAAAGRRALRVDATRWLKSLLRGGRMPVSEIEREAKGAGYSWATVRRARRELPVDAQRVFDDRDGYWVWEMKAEVWLAGPNSVAAEDKPRPLPKVQFFKLATMKVVHEFPAEPADVPADGAPTIDEHACRSTDCADFTDSRRGVDRATTNGRAVVAGHPRRDQGAQPEGQGAQLARQGAQLARQGAQLAGTSLTSDKQGSNAGEPAQRVGSPRASENGRPAGVGASARERATASKARRVKRKERKRTRKLVAIGLKR